jgi:hypothetical protein
MVWRRLAALEYMYEEELYTSPGLELMSWTCCRKQCNTHNSMKGASLIVMFPSVIVI